METPTHTAPPVDLHRLVRYDFCDGLGAISFNPNLNPNAFPASTSAPCRHCEGKGYTEPSWNFPGSTKCHDCDGTGISDSANREFIDRFVCLSAALYPTKMLEYPGVGGAWRLLYARNERKATNLSEIAQIRAQK
jgi:hypothetical protein